MAEHLPDYSGRRVTVMGLGRFGGGVGVARFLAGRGADVRVTDMLPADELAASVAQLDGVAGVALRLGEHNVSDFTTCDLLVVNPAVKPGNRFVRAARAAGVEVTSEIRLLVKHLPNRLRTIGVTGSAGKSTTAAMVAHGLRALLGQEGVSPLVDTETSPTPSRQVAKPPRRAVSGSGVWIGGNIGGSLLPRIDFIGPDDWVVLELSSFMLEGLRGDRWSPHIAVVTNIVPNHLDWHGSMEAYEGAKKGIAEFQRVEDWDALVTGRVSDDWLDFPAPRHAMLGRLSTDRGDGAAIPLRIPGRHNQLNFQYAAAAIRYALHDLEGIHERSIDAASTFPGLPHRLQSVGERRGVSYYNDSKSTTPEAATLAIEAFAPQSVRIILGGSDKGSDLAPLARFAAQRCAGVYTIGTTGGAIADAAEAYEPPAARPESCGAVAWPPPTAIIRRCGTLDAAMDAIAADVKPGENVVLSPGCASWDQFANYEARGDAFVARVPGGARGAGDSG